MTLRSKFQFRAGCGDVIFTITPIEPDKYHVSWPYGPAGEIDSVVYSVDSLERFLRANGWIAVENANPVAGNHPHTGVAAENVQTPLDKRKVGKVQMNLVDSGFPNAMLALGQVMTWAAENKGYLPHDWVNIADPDVAFVGAASRHRTESEVQRSAGLPADKRVDAESGILHKAHEAFNVLAQLELVLRGKIV